MKVASYFTLKNADENLFNLWLDTLPRRWRKSHREMFWLRAQGKKAVLWTEDGFKFF